MTNRPVHHTIDTAEEMRSAILYIIDKRSLQASQSQYDTHVCVGAVRTARNTFESISVEGTATEYGKVVVAALYDLQRTYNDPDGEYTSGKASIGDIYYDVSNLIDNLKPTGP